MKKLVLVDTRKKRKNLDYERFDEKINYIINNIIRLSDFYG